MKICHVALYTKDLEKLKDFYIRYFNGAANKKYYNPAKGFSSYFIRFGTDAELEIMTLDEGLTDMLRNERNTGYAHMAFSAGSRDNVDRLTAQIKADGYSVISGPRATGDGHYESCVLDPDGNRVEIAAEG